MWGAFAEYVRDSGRASSPRTSTGCPTGLDDEVAAFLDPLASVLHGWNRLREPAGSLLVYGAGALAFLWAAVASRRGLEVLVAGRRPERAAAGRAFRRAVRGRGARDAELAARGGPRPTSPWTARETARSGSACPRSCGRAARSCSSAAARRGRPSASTPRGCTTREIALIGSFHYTPAEARAALDALASGEIDPRPLIADRGALSDLPRFLDAQARGEGVRYAVLGG